MAKLTYKIVGRRTGIVDRTPSARSAQMGIQAQPPIDVDYVDVEWTHADGFPGDYMERAVKMEEAQLVIKTLLAAAVSKKAITQAQADAVKACDSCLGCNKDAPDVAIIKVQTEVRKVIKDQLIVPSKTPDSTIAMMLDERHKTLAAALKVEE